MSTLPLVITVEELLARREARPLWSDPAVTTTLPYGDELTYVQLADRIIEDVARGGDEALRRLAAAVGDRLPEQLEVSREQLHRAVRGCPADVVEAISAAARRIEAFHRREPVASWQFEQDGVTLGQLARPVEAVGVYVPGGQAPLVSSLLMAALPARVAGVGQIVVCTPPTEDGGISPLLAAGLLAAEVDRVFTVGGPAAIAAMAQGTASVPPVDLLCGPGAGPTVAALARVAGLVGVVSLPGPTETLLIADTTADPVLVAADLIAQAEHGPDAWPVLVTPSADVAAHVQDEVTVQLDQLPRRAIAQAALGDRGAIVVTASVTDAIDVANRFAPEHLCLLVEDPWRYLDQVRHAGGVFVGEAACEALGDYVAGPSHIMPTGLSARWSSALSVRDFVRMTAVISATPDAARQLASAGICLAEAEGLTGHAHALRLRQGPASEGS